MRGATSRLAAATMSQMLEAKIDFAGSGDTTLIAGVASQTVRIHRIFFVVGAATNIIFKDGATALTGAIPMLANGSFVLDYSGEPWFTTTAANGFVVNSSAGVQISGRIYYTQGTPTP